MDHKQSLYCDCFYLNIFIENQDDQKQEGEPETLLFRLCENHGLLYSTCSWGPQVYGKAEDSVIYLLPLFCQPEM
jgi:hypothetical protein